MNISLPGDVAYILNKLHEHGFAGYIVGGCVRDSLLNKVPHDWDITTNAQPDQVKQLFAKTIATGIKHGTVTAVINGKQYDITTYRHAGNGTGVRRSDNTTSLKEDLSRRDFTINAMAYQQQTGLVDYFNGVSDLRCAVINAVGDPEQRFQEDALRMMRAIRLACQLGFTVGTSTLTAITRNHQLLRHISAERIRNELCRIMLSKQPARGIELLHSTLLLSMILPELTACADFDHVLAVLDAAPKGLTVRLAALLHGIGKPISKKENKSGDLSRYHLERADIVRDILRRLKFAKQTVDSVCILVREQLNRFDFPNKANIKRLINRVGLGNLQSFFELQIAEIKASQPPHHFSALNALSEQVCKIIKEKQPLTVKDLAVNGDDLITIGIQPGVQMGQILNSLLEKVLEEPEMNTKENLLNIITTEQGENNI
ncbi:MAG TPA: CCA tRNA nucleotidyltransferase [Oscillospiraceae bacterium]|nr:CCA tRNA nucleotidyltransferase [Oscillospiraceae bacterium]